MFIVLLSIPNTHIYIQPFVLYRLDEDQCARRNAFKFADHLSAEHDDPDYYEMECRLILKLILMGFICGTGLIGKSV